MPSTKPPKKRRTSRHVATNRVARLDRYHDEIPNADLIKAMRSAEKYARRKNIKTYSSVEELMAALES